MREHVNHEPADASLTDEFEVNDWTSCDKPCDNGTRSRMNAAGNESQEIRCNVQMCDAGQYRTIQMTATSGSAYKHRCFCLYKVVCDPHPYFAIGHKVLFRLFGLMRHGNQCFREKNCAGWSEDIFTVILIG